MLSNRHTDTQRPSTVRSSKVHRYRPTWSTIAYKKLKKRKKMADRIKVAVIEGDYADLCGLGLPLALSLQLQLQDLKLSGAL